MQYFIAALQQQGIRERAYFPLHWSDKKKNELQQAGAQPNSLAAVDGALAPLLLRCAEGDFRGAEPEIIELVRKNEGLCRRDNETFISLITALFVVQRFDLVAAMLRDRYGFTGHFDIEAGDMDLKVGQVQWEISAARHHKFTFDTAGFNYDNTRLEILAFQWIFPMLAHYSKSDDQENGKVILDRADVGRTPGLTYCDSRPDFFLVPDCIYVPSRGYAYARTHFKDNFVPWDARLATAFWRGATTGGPAKPGDWTSLPRIRLCQISRQYQGTGLIDAGISSVVQFGDPRIAEEIKKAGLVAGFVSWRDWIKYKYLIDIDGNSSPWSNLFQRLLTGSVVLKVESAKGFRQWYYDKLVPWENYVPVATDMWDLVDKIRWLQRHEAAARRIGSRGFELAMELSYERELDRSVHVISSAFKYFGGRASTPSPCGLQIDLWEDR
jgi:hypothetical protein